MKLVTREERKKWNKWKVGQPVEVLINENGKWYQGTVYEKTSSPIILDIKVGNIVYTIWADEVARKIRLINCSLAK